MLGASGLENREAEPDDLALVQRALNGDDSAFHALVDRHAPHLFRLASSRSASRADAEDVVQETLIGAYQGLRRFDGRASFKTWLTRILVRQAARHWNRAKWSRNTLSLDHAEAHQGEQPGSEAVDRRRDVAAILQTLAREHREVLVMREFDQMSYAQISHVLQIPIGTVESRLHRARAELREKLRDYA